MPEEIYSRYHRGGRSEKPTGVTPLSPSKMYKWTEAQAKLIEKYGDSAAEAIAFGAVRAQNLILKHGKPAIGPINVHGVSAMDQMEKYGKPAVEALSTHGHDALHTILFHGQRALDIGGTHPEIYALVRRSAPKYANSQLLALEDAMKKRQDTLEIVKKWQRQLGA